MIKLIALAALALFHMQSGLRIVVVEGEGAVNIIQQKTAVAPIVEVRDRNNLPVGGVTVTFTIQGGKTAVFAGGSQTMTVTTNAAGRAIAAAVNPLSSGTVQIQAAAVFQGQTAVATITQTNVVSAAAGGGISGTAIAGIAGGVAAGGAALALSKKEDGDSAGNDRSATPFDPAVRAAIGTYTLLTVNGAALPATTVTSPPASCPVITDNATLRLGENPQDYEVTESSRTACAIGPSTTFFSISNGNWTLSNGTITFTARNDNFILDNATLNGSTLTMTVVPPHIDAGRVAPRVSTTWRK